MRNQIKDRPTTINPSTNLVQVAGELFSNREAQEKLRNLEAELHGKLVEAIIRDKAYELISINYRLLRRVI